MSISSVVQVPLDEEHVLNIPKQFGKYELVKKIGTGSFSAVVLCRHIQTRAYYACKVVCRQLLVEQNIFDRFEQEVRVLQSLRHPNIVHLEHIVYTEDNIYLIMEYCMRGELFKYIASIGPLEEGLVIRMFRQIAEALDFVHSHNIAHRDLKPENILLDQDMNAKLADFGLCHATSAQKLLVTPCGSPFYAPPEIINNVEYDGKRADVWSLGVVLYTMATGSLPWTETNQTQLFQQIREADIVIPSRLHPALRELLQMMLQRDPAKRPTTREILEFPWLQDAVEEATGSKKMMRTSSLTGGAFKATQSNVFSQRGNQALSKKNPQTTSLARMAPIASLVRKVPTRSGKKRIE